MKARIDPANKSRLIPLITEKGKALPPRNSIYAKPTRKKKKHNFQAEKLHQGHATVKPGRQETSTLEIPPMKVVLKKKEEKFLVSKVFPVIS